MTMNGRPRNVNQPAGICRTDVVVRHDIGLHARPSLAFTRLAKSFPCSIEIEVNGSGIWLNAKSIVRIMGARIRNGAKLAIRAEGARAEEAIAALGALLESGSGEEGQHGLAP